MLSLWRFENCISSLLTRTGMLTALHPWQQGCNDLLPSAVYSMCLDLSMDVLAWARFRSYTLYYILASKSDHRSSRTAVTRLLIFFCQYGWIKKFLLIQTCLTFFTSRYSKLSSGQRYLMMPHSQYKVDKNVTWYIFSSLQPCIYPNASLRGEISAYYQPSRPWISAPPVIAGSIQWPRLSAVAWYFRRKKPDSANRKVRSQLLVYWARTQQPARNQREQLQ